METRHTSNCAALVLAVALAAGALLLVGCGDLLDNLTGKDDDPGPPPPSPALFDYGVESQINYYDSAAAPGVLEPGDKFTYSYDSSGRGTGFQVYVYDTVSAAWVLSAQWVITYDSAGKLATWHVETFDAAGIRDWWLRVIQFAYDSAGRRVRDVQEEYNFTTMMWEPGDRNSFTYDSAGREVEVLIEVYDSVLARYEDHARSVYTYDSAGRIATKTHEQTSDDGVTWNTDWSNSSSYSYDALGRLAQELGYDSSGSPNYRRVFTYQSSTDRIDNFTEEFWSSFLNQWEVGYTVYSSFDGSNRQTTVTWIDANTLNVHSREDYINTNAGSSYMWEQIISGPARWWLLYLYGYGAPFTQTF